MQAHPKNAVVVCYDRPDFINACEQLFLTRQDFLVVHDGANSARCKKAVALFIEFGTQKYKGLARLKLLAKLFFFGIREASLMAVCNKASLLGWVVELEGLTTSELLFVRKH